jgi:hypothetical protein
MTYYTSQYGNERTFAEGDSVIRAVPRLIADGIVEVVITHMNGERLALDHLITTIRDRYKGSLYSTWQKGEQ